MDSDLEPLVKGPGYLYCDLVSSGPRRLLQSAMALRMECILDQMFGFLKAERDSRPTILIKKLWAQRTKGRSALCLPCGVK